MSNAFDTLGYAGKLEAGGVPTDQAKAHAEAAKEFIMNELATKSDLKAALEMAELRMTLKIGGMLVAGLSILFALIKVTA
ncbi:MULTISPECIES: hypothetical protein [unclassified Labrenzia]|uniref:hypothetical protein n=1 Tax=unclassified Labrenzia TaxID=2648686 RepID=UPI0004B60318|nr:MULTISPECIES: hypothetical protein [unclassified Labrenzia]